MKTLKLKKLVVSVTLVIAAGVFLFSGNAFAANLQFVLSPGQTQATQTITRTEGWFIKYWWSVNSKSDWDQRRS